MTQILDRTAHPTPPQPPDRVHDPVAPGAEGDSRGEESRPRHRSRDPLFDNAKFFAIILVVVGHVLEDLRDVWPVHALYLYVYLFHMPVFIVITGYFSRNFSFAPGKARKLITNLAVPYVVFETAYSIYHWLVDGARLQITLLDPYYLTWFLMALFAWRLSTPVWQQVRWPLLWAVGISLLSGLEELPREFELNRMLGLLPFFVLGLMLKPAHFALLHRPAVRWLGAATLLGGLGTVPFADRRMATEWAYWRHSNGYLGVSAVTGSAMRLGMLVAATILVAAFLAVVPTRHAWYTSLGQATLYAYLLHGFVTKLLEYQGWYDASWLHTPGGVVVAAAGATVLAVLLMTPPVRRALHWAVEPRMSWAFTGLRRPGDQRGGHGRAEPGHGSAEQSGSPDSARATAPPPARARRTRRRGGHRRRARRP